ncbi:albusnodin/ikarugamycin family macrolactam cyclase [Streptomyces roseifaciens]
MLRWFGGCAPGGQPLVPEGARLVWSHPPLWTAGTWSDRLLKTADGHGGRLAAFGPCAATSADLARALAAPDLSRVAGTWPGSYTVVRLGVQGAVEVITDAASACPVYTTRTARGLVWGSSSWALSTLARGGIDTGWLASYLLDKQNPLPGHSPWADVAPVPAGHRLTLAPGGTARVSPWWSPARRSYADAVPLIRRALTEGVRARMEDTPVSCDLAGTDSTTVAVIASQYGPVRAMTAHPEGVTDGGDMAYARLLSVPGLTRTLFPIQSRHLPFSPADDPLPVTDEPAPSSSLWAMFSAQMRAATGAGPGCHLTGDGGDNLFIAPPTHLADLARRRRFLRLAGDALAWAQLRKTSPWPLLSAALGRDAHRLARPWLTRPPWLLAPAPAPTAGQADADAVLVADVRGAARPAYADAQLAEALGAELHNPYFDALMLDAVASVPSWDRFTVRRYKPLLTDAIGDLLPEAHRTRATKGTFAGDFHRGVRVNLPRVLGLADGRLAAMGLVDPGPLRTAIHAVALGAETVWPPLLAALVAEMWAEAAACAAPLVWTPPREASP